MIQVAEAKQVSAANKVAFDSTIQGRKVRKDRNTMDFQSVLDNEDLSRSITFNSKLFETSGS